MSDQTDRIHMRLSELVLLKLDGQITPPQAQELDSLLRSGPGAMDFYLTFTAVCGGMAQHAKVFESNLPVEMTPATGKGIHNQEFWELLSMEEKTAEAVDPPEAEAQAQPLRHPVVEKTPRKIRRASFAAAVFALAALVFLLAYVQVLPVRKSVAVVTKSMDAVWADSDDAPEQGETLYNTDAPRTLRAGTLELIFGYGAKVVLESPCEFVCRADDQIVLNYGKLYAKVPRAAIGFSVVTPNTKVIDLGTEFGLMSGIDGVTETHVFKGQVALFAGQGNQKFSLPVSAGFAKRIDAANAVSNIAIETRRFVREIDSTNRRVWRGEALSLANVAAGGSGFGPAPMDRGIDPKTGRLVTGKEEKPEAGEHRYVPVPELSFVDGVFVPDGGDGPVQLTSAGHTFDAFGDTGGGYFMSIGAYDRVNMNHMEGMKVTPIRLDGCPADAATNLCLHANAGITFDLQKIREAMPWVKISEFKSVYGIPRTRPDQTDVTSDFFVFVDGVPRMVKRRVSFLDAPAGVSVPLAPTDRFLTLVCTEGDNNFGDWSLFVNPVLVLESIE